ncbi:MAG TPA: acyl carrier protein [Planctomycetota bacterium]|nr:acyl carrier protein [Planctomycetota bacterium]
MNSEQIAESIESFIRARFRISADDARFSRHSSLWEEGYVDSIGVMELVAHIESTFGVVLPDEVFFDPGFTNVEGMATIVSKLPRQRVA